jgi:flagellar biosynthesis protein FlhA
VQQKPLAVEALELEIGLGLLDLCQGPGGVLARLSHARGEIAEEIGVRVPGVRVRDNPRLAKHAYRVRLRGNGVAGGEVMPGRVLAMQLREGLAPLPDAIEGVLAREPIEGAPAWWIHAEDASAARHAGYETAEAPGVIAGHAAYVVRTHADELISREDVGVMLEELARTAPRLVAETVPGVVKPAELLAVLRGLLRERVPVRDLETILGALAEAKERGDQGSACIEAVRLALRRTICGMHAHTDISGASVLPCVRVHPTLESTLRDGGPELGEIARRCAKASRKAGGVPVVVDAGVRRRLADGMAASKHAVAVVSEAEVAPGVALEVRGVVGGEAAQEHQEGAQEGPVVEVRVHAVGRGESAGV